jgi:hypothetical protein
MASSLRSDRNYLQAPHPRSELHLGRKCRESQLRYLFLKSVLRNLPQRYLVAIFQLCIGFKKVEERRKRMTRGQSSSICFTPTQPGQANLLHLTRCIVRHGLILNSAFARHLLSREFGVVHHRWIGMSRQPGRAVKMLHGGYQAKLRDVLPWS